MVVAMHWDGAADAEGFPEKVAWNAAQEIRFDHDWQGKNQDTGRETEVRVLWSTEALYLRFVARYRTITVFEDAEPSGRREELWNRDVAEAFLEPPGSPPRCYREFEVSPNGFWIDLDIAPGNKKNLQSGLRRRVCVDERERMWTAELMVPMTSLTARFAPKYPWRVNFFRVEGASEPRFYSAWRPTGTPVPNFHVPETFGTLVFEL
jgi:alpha-galactosidase